MSPEVGKLSETEIEAVLNEQEVGYLALTKEGQPYLVPLNYLYSGGKIYFHSRSSGRKVEYIQANPVACFNAVETGPLIPGVNPCLFSYNFSSVLIEGTIEEIGSESEKLAILELLVEKYAKTADLRGQMIPELVDEVKVFCLNPAGISGKKKDMSVL